MLMRLINKFKRDGFVSLLKRIFWELRFQLSKLLSFKKVTSRYGVKLYSNYDDATFYLYHTGGLGFILSRLLEDIKDEFYFVDIGANQGLYSIIASKNQSCTKVFAFEPIPETFDFLKKNIELNDCAQKCLCVQKAISNESGVKRIFFSSSHSGGASLVHNDSLFNHSQNAIDIDCIDFVALNTILVNCDKRIFVKIDVEGYELTVLHQLFKTQVAKNIYAIFYEVNESWVDKFKIESLLRAKGFQSFQKFGINNADYY